MLGLPLPPPDTYSHPSRFCWGDAEDPGGEGLPGVTPRLGGNDRV